MARVYEGQPAARATLGGPFERVALPAVRIDPAREMRWTEYAVAVMVFNILGLLVVYALQRLQDVLPLNPQDLAAVSPDSSFNTAVSFATNTNWQGYGGETTMSYLTQMLGLDRAELRVRGDRHGGAGRARFAASRAHRRRRSATSGSISCASTLYILLPLSLVLARGAGVAGRGADVLGQDRRRAAVTLTSKVDAPASRSRTTRATVTESHARTDDRRRTGGVADRHQAARHQRRRLLQRQLGPSVRESDAAVELPRDALDPADPGRALLHVRRRWSATRGRAGRCWRR